MGGSVDPGTVFSLKKNTILTQLMCSFCKRSINLEETISTRLPTTIVTHVLHNNFWLFKRLIILFTGQARSRGRGRGGSSPPPEIFRLELNSATKVEFFY